MCEAYTTLIITRWSIKKMKYGIITLGDIHWDAFDINRQKRK